MNDFTTLVYIKTLLKMILSIAPGLLIIFGCIAAITEVKQDKTWLRKILNKYMLGVE